jgi:hypothetical protein
MKRLSFCDVPSRSFWLSLASLLVLLFIAVPGRADIVQFSGYNSAIATAIDVLPCPLCSPNQTVAGQPLGGATVHGSSGFATAFPGQNKSYLKAVSDEVSSPAGYNAGTAFAEANVHYHLIDKRTGKPTAGVIDMTIKGSASLSLSSLTGTLEDNAGWSVTVGQDFPAPILNLEYSGSGLVNAYFFNNIPAIVDGEAAGGLFITEDGRLVSSSGSRDLNGTTGSKDPNMSATLHLLVGTSIDVDERVAVAGIGYAVLDPILTPVDPNDVLVSDAPVNPEPNAPLFTTSEVASLAAEGVDVSGLSSLGLVGTSTSVPEPRALPIVAIGICALLILRKCRTGRVL